MDDTLDILDKQFVIVQILREQNKTTKLHVLTVDHHSDPHFLSKS